MNMMPVFPSDFPPSMDHAAHARGVHACILQASRKLLGSMKAKEASHRDRPEPGTNYVARRGQHMRQGRRGMNLIIEL
jgi:chemotaxis response regulator CheB